MRGRTFFVYVMSSVSRTLYTGVTNDLPRRVAEHREQNPGSFTARYRITRLVYFEEYNDARDAIARETKIKNMSRRGKTRLIEAMNPEWKDLLAD